MRSVRRKRFVIAEQAWLGIKHSVAPAVRKRPCACYWLRPPHTNLYLAILNLCETYQEWQLLNFC